MSTVVVDIDNQYCDDIRYSYQITQSDSGLYEVYKSWDILRGEYLGRKLETFAEAWQILNEEMQYAEDLEI